jgi:hypothetical protein
MVFHRWYRPGGVVRRSLSIESGSDLFVRRFADGGNGKSVRIFDCSVICTHSLLQSQCLDPDESS